MQSETPELAQTDSVGGCSLGCAGLFLLTGVLWPLLHLIGRSFEPEVLFIPFVIGIPAFLVTHLLALFSWSGNHDLSKGKTAVRIIWFGIGVAIVVLLIAISIDEIRRRWA